MLSKRSKLMYLYDKQREGLFIRQSVKIKSKDGDYFCLMLTLNLLSFSSTSFATCCLLLLPLIVAFVANG